MLVLALDTATPAVTAGVVSVLLPNEIGMSAGAAAPADPVAVLAQRQCNDAFGHAEQLMPQVELALRDAGVTIDALDAVVVGLGPGPFTGLRVGIATAEALGDGLDRPVHGVPSHDGLIRSLPKLTGPTVVVTDARRREVYVSAYDASGRRIVGPTVLPPAALPDLIGALPAPPVALAGAGAALAGLDLPVVELGSPVLGLVRVAAPALVTGAVPGPLTPLYLRRPDVTVSAGPKCVLG
jgi:tRNA threonylcarbamoyl adenosine modification protein YeaZ